MFTCKQAPKWQWHESPVFINAQHTQFTEYTHLSAVFVKPQEIQMCPAIRNLDPQGLVFRCSYLRVPLRPTLSLIVDRWNTLWCFVSLAPQKRFYCGFQGRFYTVEQFSWEFPGWLDYFCCVSYTLCYLNSCSSNLAAKFKSGSFLSKPSFPETQKNFSRDFVWKRK